MSSVVVQEYPQSTKSIHGGWELHALDTTCFSSPSDLYRCCLDGFHTGATSAELHPDSIASEMAAHGDRQIHLLWNDIDRIGGALAPKLAKSGRIVGKRVPIQAHGVRLVGNQVIGKQDANSAQKFVDQAVNSLEVLNRDCLLIEDVEVGSVMWRTLRSAQKAGSRLFLPNGIQRRFKIELPESMDDYWNSFSKKPRYNLRRAVKLAGDINVECITDAGQIAGFLDAAHAISTKSWQSQRIGVRIANDDRELQRYVALATLGLLRCYLLTTGETHPHGADVPVAFVVGTQCNGYYSYEEIGYDQDFASVSPGKVLLIKLLEDLYSRNTPKWLDFGGGDAEYKRTFANHSTRSGNVVLFAKTRRARAVAAGMTAARATDSFLRATIGWLGLKTRLRQWFRKRA